MVPQELLRSAKDGPAGFREVWHTHRLMAGIHERAAFLRCFLRNAAEVGSLVPTSPAGVRNICDRMDFSQRRVIVEYGPGTGVISEEVLKRMTPDSLLILLEINNDFVQLLRNKLQSDRVRIFRESAENIERTLLLCGENRADYIVSGIPFSRIPRQIARHIVQQTYHMLKEDGVFIAYQLLSSARRYMKERFQKVIVFQERQNFPWRLQITEARKS